ncbi:MAG: hypothetical protein KTR23_11775 [Rhodospirillales bacterium]|nr:hypothetical protein [Rhodospirillales bacterium]
MTGRDANNDPLKSHQIKNQNPDQGTVLDRIKMPPMSGEEALRRFDEDRSASDGSDHGTKQQSDLAELHPIMKLVALGGTLVMVVTGLLGVLYLFAV